MAIGQNEHILYKETLLIVAGVSLFMRWFKICRVAGGAVTAECYAILAHSALAHPRASVDRLCHPWHARH
ncbi:hypothetical protein AXX12_08955 [Anaerosporomusa subterranea]|uniref:Uncharacterized protein n=1 Tax=Anaerosporomusa subterranea TaxID=1794912 RepID=A0A154BRM1_ANASB|nr:hypothetical protein AXX12_08955 [Anaerosporomusa subterranea]